MLFSLFLFCFFQDLRDDVLESWKPLSEVTQSEIDLGKALKQKLVDAHGGMERLQSIETLWIAHEYQRFYRAKIKSKTLNIISLKHPVAFRVSYHGTQSMVSCLNNDVTWRRSVETSSYSEERTYKASYLQQGRLKNLIVALTSGDVVFAAMEKSGKHTVRSYWRQDGRPLADYTLNPSTNLVAEVVIWGQEKRDGSMAYIHSFLSNYQNVDGIPFPFVKKRFGDRPAEKRYQWVVINRKIPEKMLEPWLDNELLPPFEQPVKKRAD